SVLLAMIGGLLGVLLSAWGVDGLLATIPDYMVDKVPQLSWVTINNRVLLFTLAVSIITGIAFGWAPAMSASRPSLMLSLKESGISTSGGPRSGRLRDCLVVAEIALALVLLIGAGLMIRSFLHLHTADLGFQEENLLTMRLSLSRSR